MPIRVELTIMLKSIVVAQSIFTAADAEEGAALDLVLASLTARR